MKVFSSSVTLAILALVVSIVDHQAQHYAVRHSGGVTDVKMVMSCKDVVDHR